MRISQSRMTTSRVFLAYIHKYLDIKMSRAFTCFSQFHCNSRIIDCCGCCGWNSIFHWNRRRDRNLFYQKLLLPSRGKFGLLLGSSHASNRKLPVWHDQLKHWRIKLLNEKPNFGHFLLYCCHKENMLFPFSFSTMNSSFCYFYCRVKTAFAKTRTFLLIMSILYCSLQLILLPYLFELTITFSISRFSALIFVKNIDCPPLPHLCIYWLMFFIYV